MKESEFANPGFSVDGIIRAQKLIAPYIIKTPITHSATLSAMCDCDILFKLENLQMTGSFKERGAVNKLLSLDASQRRQGVIAASAGNHAQAVAYHASKLGISTKIVMPRHSPLVKIRSTEHWGAEVILEGETFDEAFLHSQHLMEKENRIYLHPFDDPRVAEGQGTLAPEILSDPRCESLDAILVPVGGGGLIAGITTYVKSVIPEIRVIGVEESTVDAMSQSTRAGRIVDLAPQPTIADGIAVGRVGSVNLGIVIKSVDDIVTVSSDEIANAIMLMLEIEKTVIEGAAAVTLAALLNHRLPWLHGKRVLSVISGGNIDVNVLSKIINRGLSHDGRIVKLESIIADRPGALETLLGIFRESGANVLEVHHHRFSGQAPVGQIGISITVETRNQHHIDQLKALLNTRGYSADI
ncbi:MAG: threonine ammonia-lyase [bacterium]|nr:threonine ammonia-lyase [Gammaproteobacteria bacterium]HIL98649.1 threonine ammonia-lyase [Pseudomonadales bacterium]